MNPDSPIEQKHYDAWCGEYAEHKSFVGMHSDDPLGRSSGFWIVTNLHSMLEYLTLDVVQEESPST